MGSCSTIIWGSGTEILNYSATYQMLPPVDYLQSPEISKYWTTNRAFCVYLHSNILLYQGLFGEVKKNHKMDLQFRKECNNSSVSMFLIKMPPFQRVSTLKPPSYKITSFSQITFSWVSKRNFAGTGSPKMGEFLINLLQV